MNSILLFNFPEKSNKTITLPASKSISNRLLMVEFLSKNNFGLQNISSADDTQLLKKLFVEIQKNEKTGSAIYCKNAGTTLRFLLSVLSITEGNWVLTGDENMQRRPIKELVETLVSLGADIGYFSANGFPPLFIKGKKLMGGHITIRTNVSSQFTSSVMLLAPFLQNGLTITLNETILSKPYIEMTQQILLSCAVPVEWNGNTINISSSKPTKSSISFIENDWSAASYFYAAVALGKEYSFFLKGLQEDTLQGDGQALPLLFQKLGVQTIFKDNGVQISKSPTEITDYFEFDFSHCPDLAQTFAVCCAGLKVRAHLKGLSSLRIKETDRLYALFVELKKMNVAISIQDDSLIIEKSELICKEPVQTYADHRMAMAFAPLACCFPVVEIMNPEVVEKSFPHFWKEFEF